LFFGEKPEDKREVTSEGKYAWGRTHTLDGEARRGFLVPFMGRLVKSAVL